MTPKSTYSKGKETIPFDEDWATCNTAATKEQKDMYAIQKILRKCKEIEYQPPNKFKVRGGTKCTKVYIGGGHLNHGVTCLKKPMSCCALKCLICDKPVHRFVNGYWNEVIDEGYVRSFNRNPKQLQTNITFEAGFSSYACAC